MGEMKLSPQKLYSVGRVGSISMVRVVFPWDLAEYISELEVQTVGISPRWVALVTQMIFLDQCGLRKGRWVRLIVFPSRP
jgi:hypothetical protein